MDAKDFTFTQQELQNDFDYKDGHLFWKKRVAKCVHIGDKAGCLKPKGYISIRYKNQYYQAHRLIYMWHFGDFKEDIDHFDGNKANNRIENLRKATDTQNQYNKKIGRNNISGIKGVFWAKDYQKWEARIKVNKKPIYVGRYNSLEEAKIAIEKFRQEHHGEFARHQ